MAAKTGTELRNVVKSHLGDREDGYIGSDPVDTAVLDSINTALMVICKRYDADTMRRIAEIDVSDSAYQYNIPTTDEDGNTIRIKNFVRLTMQQDSETTRKTLIRLSTTRRDKVFPTTNTDHQGRPVYYSIWNQKIELFPYPDDDYTIYCRCNIWPTDIDSSTLGTSQPLGEEFDDVIENYAVYHCFTKLQQTEDASMWLGKFELSLKETINVLRAEPDWEPDMNMYGSTYASNPIDNPFVRHYNS